MNKVALFVVIGGFIGPVYRNTLEILRYYYLYYVRITELPFNGIYFHRNIFCQLFVSHS